MEEWRDIPGYEGLYQVSNEGRVRTAEGKTTSNARYARRVWEQRILKLKYAKRKNKEKSDAHVSLWKDGKEKTWLVSRLTALTWCEGYSEGLTVNHIDGNPLNNNKNNLEWISFGDNIRHGFKTNLYHTQKECSLEDSIGNKYIFRSMSEACKFLDRDHRYISAFIRRGKKEITSKDGTTYKIA